MRLASSIPSLIRLAPVSKKYNLTQAVSVKENDL